MPTAPSLQRATRQALARLGLRPRRRLGQSFLVAAAVVERIVDVADVRGKRGRRDRSGPRRTVGCAFSVGIAARSRGDRPAAIRSPAGSLHDRDSRAGRQCRRAGCRLRGSSRGSRRCRRRRQSSIQRRHADPPSLARGGPPLRAAGADAATRGRRADRRRAGEQAVRYPERVDGALWRSPHRVPGSAECLRASTQGRLRDRHDRAPRTSRAYSIADPKRFRDVVRGSLRQATKDATRRARGVGHCEPRSRPRASIPSRRGETLSLEEFAAIANLLTAGTR